MIRAHNDHGNDPKSSQFLQQKVANETFRIWFCCQEKSSDDFQSVPDFTLTILLGISYTVYDIPYMTKTHLPYDMAGIISRDNAKYFY